MADSTIDGLTAGSAPDGAVEFPGWQSTDMFKFLLADMRGWNLTTGISAAGTDQSGATALSNSSWVHIVGTVGSGAGVKFASLGTFVTVQFRIVCCLESAANDLLLYPASTGQINNLGVNAAITIEKGSSALLYAISNLNWRTMP
jgi:hypothetical protein